MQENRALAADSVDQEPSRGFVTVVAVATGALVANLYYAQPLIGPITADLGLSPQSAGLIVTMTQLGYGAGLLLIVPLGDPFESRDWSCG